MQICRKSYACSSFRELVRSRSPELCFKYVRLTRRRPRSRNHAAEFCPAPRHIGSKPGKRNTTAIGCAGALGVPDGKTTRFPADADGGSGFAGPCGAGSGRAHRSGVPPWAAVIVSGDVAAPGGVRARAVAGRRYRWVVQSDRSKRATVLTSGLLGEFRRRRAGSGWQ